MKVNARASPWATGYSIIDWINSEYEGVEWCTPAEMAQDPGAVRF